VAEEASGNPKWRHIYIEHTIGPRWVVWTPRWANIIRGGHYSVPASINVVTEAVVLEEPPRLIGINQGGHFKAPASVNRFCEVVCCNRLG
jgi:hypothetical protein